MAKGTGCFEITELTAADLDVLLDLAIRPHVGQYAPVETLKRLEQLRLIWREVWSSARLRDYALTIRGELNLDARFSSLLPEVLARTQAAAPSEIGAQP